MRGVLLRRACRWGALVTWLSAHHVDIGGIRVSLASLLVAVGIIIAGFVIASKLSARVRGETENGSARVRWRGTLAKVTGYAIRVVAVAIALQVTGVDIGNVLAAGAVVAVGIGIAMQKVAENFVSGVILMAERSIREGDIIEFDGRVARVRHVGIRATIALTLDEEEIIVPNSILAQSAVKNLTLTDAVYRLRVRVGVSYSSDLALVERVLRAAAESVEWRDEARAPIVLLADFASSSVDFEVSVWTRDVWGMRRGQSELRKAVWQALQGAAITIPFPQVDVHFDAARAAPGAADEASKAAPTTA
jgi:potassium-dependent mechanosensitive channel